MPREQSFWDVPYVSRMEGDGIQPGQTLILRGNVTGGRFDVNLAASGHDGGDIPLHVSVRVEDKEIVMNTLQGGSWGKEERKKCPFKEGEDFDLRIRAHDDKFEVFAEQKEINEYHYRMPLSTVTHLRIDGALQLQHINWGGQYYPVPFETAIQGGFPPGKRLYVSGVPDPKAKRFSINLLTPNGDTALHLDTRFDEKKMVRNSQSGGEWGKEEREGDFPVDKQHAFDYIINNESYAFQIIVNGNHYNAFAHRLDSNNITGLRIEGDVELQGVHFK